MFTITQNFQNTLEKIFRNKYNKFDLTQDLETDQENYQEIGLKAWIKFWAPLKAVCLLTHLDFSNDNLICKHCIKTEEKQERLQLLKKLLTKYPQVAFNARLMIQSRAYLDEDSIGSSKGISHIQSLKMLSIRRVLEFGLDQKSLPLSLKEQMRRGPEPRSLTAKEDRMMDQLQQLVKEIMTPPAP